jgi:hypothetical protein
VLVRDLKAASEQVAKDDLAVHGVFRTPEGHLGDERAGSG